MHARSSQLGVARWASPRLLTPLVLAASVAVSVGAGMALGRADGSAVPMPVMGLVAVAGAIILFTLPVKELFLGWLFLAPLFQAAAADSSVGDPLAFGLYLAPAAVIGCLTIVHWRRRSDVAVVDVLPALYAAFALVSALVSSPLLDDNPTGLAKEVFLRTLIGVVVYYFLVFGPGAGIRATAIVRALLAGVLVQAALALVEWATGWTVWGADEHDGTAFARSTGTLSSSGALGAYLGCGIVLALAVLAWSGPARLRRVAWITVALGVPALMATLTRGPIIATAVAALGLLLLARRGRLVAVGLVVIVAVVLVQLWPQIEQTKLYQSRITDRVNVQGREDIQDVSLKAAAERPVFGWGYGSFEDAKVVSASGFDARVRGSLETTSHNTFLTVLVELGGLGLAFLLVPWVVIMGRGLATVRRRIEDSWLIVGCMAAVAVWFLTANTTDQKYFSLVSLLPWLLLGLIRRALNEGGARSAS